MASDLLGISVTGLRVSQSALSTVGHNIANANVEGYTRQRVIAETNPANLDGGNYIGNGANVGSIERIMNQFVVEQLRSDSSLFNGLNSYHENISQLDRLLSDGAAGLSAGLEKFFAAVQNGADEPTSIAARQLIISEAENIEDRFGTMYSRLADIEEGVSESLSVAVSQANALIKNIGELNRKITEAIGVSNGAAPNDLLDQRDEALKKLSEIINIQTYDQGFGQVNVLAAGGQSLVVGSQVNTLQLQTSESDPEKLDVAVKNNLGSQVVTDKIRGGEIGGLLRFRDSVMADTYNSLGRIAVVLADTFNQVHQQGLTLNGEFGGRMFYDVNDPNVASNRVIGSANNAAPANRELSLNIIDSSQLTVSDYSVTIANGGSISIERLSDGVEVATGALPGSYPFSVEFDGMELVFESGSFQAGDSFKLQPVKSGARDFTTVIAHASDIAFGSPLLTDSSIGNTGSGIISAGEVQSLVDVNGQPLPLFQNAGEMNPPLIVRFTSETTYDILDNSDPANPVQLEPPIRNQRFVAGMNNNLFSSDPGGTMVSTAGELIGLPAGRNAVTQAALLMTSPPALAPDFSVNDFSATTNQFSFDIVVANTVGAASDGTHTININGPALSDEDSLLQHINSQLASSDVSAYIADNGTLAFRLNSVGYGDITLQNYDGDPDGNADNAPAGQANNLLGFNIEAGSFTTVGNADGASGFGTFTNGYPAEAITVSRPSSSVGSGVTTENIFTNRNASAREIAAQLSNMNGVSANAFNYIELSGFDVSLSEPLQISVNGYDLIEYATDSVTGNPVISGAVPDPQTEPEAFNEYLASRINENSAFQSAGINAVAGRDAITGRAEVRLYSSEGDNFQVNFTAANGESIDVSDGENPNLSLISQGNNIAAGVVVGGKIDVSLAEGVTLGSFPPDSMLFGDTRATDFAQSTYLGIQAAIGGSPDAGDTFTLDFNRDGVADNRNALALVNLASAKTIGNGLYSYSGGYGDLVEKIGIDSSSTKISLDASEQVLEQTVARRNSISAVNLDEEAADLIRFEQMYSANAQVISVARDLFDRLIGSF